MQETDYWDRQTGRIGESRFLLQETQDERRSCKKGLELRGPLRQHKGCFCTDFFEKLSRVVKKGVKF